MGKGGGGKNQTSTVTQTNIPAWARPYMENALQRGQEESNRPYQPYQGQRIASQTPQTLQGLNMIQNYAQSGMGDLDNARSLSEMVGNRAMDLQNYEAGGVNNTYNGAQDYSTGQFDAGQVGFGSGGIDKLTSQQFGAAERDQYMSPYMDSVVAASQADAQRKALEEQALLKGEAAKAGAFGGSRGAVQQQMALGQAQQRISDIGVQGRQAAFENSQQQFERDQQRAAQAAGNNLQYGVQMGLANQSQGLEAQKLGEQSRQFGASLQDQGAQKASEMGMTAQSQTEQLRQAGKKLGLEGLNLAGSTATQLGQFQQLNDSLTMQRANAMLGTGQFQEEYNQKQLDTAYSDFLNQQNWPLQRLSIVPSILNGIPMGQNQTQTVTQGSNPLQSVAGTAMAYDALNRLGNGRGGG